MIVDSRMSGTSIHTSTLPSGPLKERRDSSTLIKVYWAFKNPAGSSLPVASFHLVASSSSSVVLIDSHPVATFFWPTLGSFVVYTVALYISSIDSKSPSPTPSCRLYTSSLPSLSGLIPTTLELVFQSILQVSLSLGLVERENGPLTGTHKSSVTCSARLSTLKPIVPYEPRSPPDCEAD